LQPGQFCLSPIHQQRTGLCGPGQPSSSKKELRTQSSSLSLFLFLSLSLSLSLSASLPFWHMFEIRHKTSVCEARCEIAKSWDVGFAACLPDRLTDWKFGRLRRTASASEMRTFLNRWLEKFFFTGQTGENILAKRYAILKQSQKRTLLLC